MTERAPTSGAPGMPGSVPGSLAGSAGTLLREARLAQGVHIAALAASIKVAPRKLEALENDKLDELLDPSFARALAKTVCRVLKIDPEPVLARMPQPPALRLEQAARGLDQPFRGGALRPSREPSALLRPVVWGPLLIVLAAVGLMLLPPGLLRDFSASISSSSTPASAVATPLFPPPAASAPEAAVATSPDVAASAPAPTAEAAAAPATPVPAALPESMIVVTARADSWVGILDGNAHPLIARTVHAGETVRFDGTPPFRIKIGNAAGTELIFRGQAVDLSTTRDNVARLELK